MNNTRFATALHILTLLAKNPHEFLSSEWIAGSLNVNPVVVRRELAVLKAAQLVESKQGKEGGVRLVKSATQIDLSDIFLAVQAGEVLGKKNQHPNPNCPIGKRINEKLDELFLETQKAIVTHLKNKTLASFSEKFE